MTNEELAWLAGLFEGEGYLTFIGSNSVRIGISMTDLDVIKRVRNVCGRNVGHIVLHKQGVYKLRYDWYISDRDNVRRLIYLLLPKMCERRTIKMIESLKRLENNRGKNTEIDHGTLSGYKKELLRGQAPCDLCRKANSDYCKNNYNTEKRRQKYLETGK